MTMKSKVIAFYLPQFHPCEANDEFWESGFTDWVTTKNAQPIYNGHAQPIAPTALGEYSLENKEVIKQQAQMAKEYGVDGFAIYHYWFGKGQRALETPINLIRKNEDINIDYFISWVNCDWTKSWIGEHEVVIRKQEYDLAFYIELIEDALTHFSDERYVKMDGKPLFYIHNPNAFDVRLFIEIFNEKALERGWKGIHFIAPEIHADETVRTLFDHLIGFPPGDHMPLMFKVGNRFKNVISSLTRKCGIFSMTFKFFRVIDFKRYRKSYTTFIKRKLETNNKYLPTLMHSWDNTPRYREKGFVYDDATPEQNKYMYTSAFKLVKEKKLPLVFIKAWNEWAEGNTLEPDEKYGYERLRALKKAREDVGI